MAKKSSGQALAKRRGRDFEYKVAKLTGGHIHTGLDGDVVADPYRFECKYRAGLRLARNDELWHWLSQVERYATQHWPAGQRWALALTGGRQAMFHTLSKSNTFVLLPMEHFLELAGLGGEEIE